MNFYNYLNETLANPVVIVSIIIILLIIFLFFNVGESNNTNGSNFQSFTTSDSSSNASSSAAPFLLFMFLFMALIVGILYFKTEINTWLVNSKLLSIEEKVQETKVEDKKVEKQIEEANKLITKKEKNITKVEKPKPSEPETIQLKKQVFHIPGNYYTYDDAKAVCSAFNAELATYDQIEKAYNKGGEWCNYGWSQDQLALFPTQEETYDMLKSKPGNSNVCGRPGVNGGYMENAKLKFGANCYGVKPPLMNETAQQTVPPFPETTEEISFRKKVESLKQKLDDILVAPFNRTSWDEI